MRPVRCRRNLPPRGSHRSGGRRQSSYGDARDAPELLPSMSPGTRNQLRHSTRSSRTQRTPASTDVPAVCGQAYRQPVHHHGPQRGSRQEREVRLSRSKSTMARRGHHLTSALGAAALGGRPRRRGGASSTNAIAIGRGEERRVLKRQKRRQGNAFWVRVPLAAGGNWGRRCGRYAQQDLIADAFPLQG
jgi:hypothetical protein